jgi:hypothetical protein
MSGPSNFQVSDKVVLIERVQSADCFKPVPQVGRVYVVREVVDAANGPALRLVGVRGAQEEGEGVSLNAAKFRKLAEVRAETAAQRKAARRTRRSPSAVSALALETIFYQGQQIEALRIAEFPAAGRRGRDGLLRDKAGLYYLQREICDGKAADLSRARGEPRQHGYRCFLHRVSLLAALSWTLCECGGSRFLLRDMTRWMQEPTRFCAYSHFVSGSLGVILRLKPGPSRLLLAACQRHGRRPVQELYHYSSRQKMYRKNGG